MRSTDIKRGFTIIELLTSITIIAILIGMLIPALRLARNTAKKASQKAQLAAMSQGLMAFKNDTGQYPPSEGFPNSNNYCGAQKLAEALLGWDLLGFHPDSNWRADGYDRNGGSLTYDPDKTRINANNIPVTLEERIGLYLSLGSANAFKLEQLFNDYGTFLDSTRYVICDSFGVRKVALAGVGKKEIVKAGTPILYYRANTSSKYELDTAIGGKGNEIYNNGDNMHLTKLGPLTANGVRSSKEHKFHDLVGPVDLYDYITDLTIWNSIGRRWPHNPDSYILISAGVDGLYGTQDDITNF